MKKFLVSLTLGFALLGGVALSQSISLPQVSTVSPTADRMQVVPNGQPSAQSVYASPAQITAVKGYYKSAPAAGFTFTFANYQSLAAFDPAGTLASGYVTFAPNPSDGTEACVFSTAAITALTVNANSGQTIADAVTTLAANAKVCYLYGISNAVWNRSE